VKESLREAITDVKELDLKAITINRN